MKSEDGGRSPQATRSLRRIRPSADRGGKPEDKNTIRASRFRLYTKLWIGIGALVLLSPLGLVLPELFRAGGAWGEWGPEEIEKMLGYVPQGFKRLSEWWSSPMSDYVFSGWDKGMKAYIAYIISGVIGVAIVAAVTYLVGRIIKRGER